MRGVREYEGSQRISRESENIKGVREYQGRQRISDESENIRGVREYQGSIEYQGSQRISGESGSQNVSCKMSEKVAYFLQAC